MYYNKKHKMEINKRLKEYAYIGSYDKKEITIDNKNKTKNNYYIRVKCLYCGKEYDIRLPSFKEGRKCTNCCNSYENSFAYHIQQELKEPLNKYWDWKKNELNPYLIYKGSGNKIWIKCDKKDYHSSYLTNCDHFYRGDRCPYCHKAKVHSKDSFGYLYPQKIKYWSKNNKKSPFEVAPKTSTKYKFYCEKCGKEFKTSPNKIIEQNRSLKCEKCTSPLGELKIKEYLINNNIEFIPQKTFKYLIGVGNGLLSYDFYLPQYNLLIEYQGEQHEKFVEGFHKSEEGFLKQKEHDRRKKKYAKDNNIRLLEIWYYDFNNIDKVIENILKGE